MVAKGCLMRKFSKGALRDDFEKKLCARTITEDERLEEGSDGVDIGIFSFSLTVLG